MGVNCTRGNAGSAQAHVLSCSRLAAGVGRRTHKALRALRIGVSTLCNPRAETLIRTQTHATLAELLELLRPFRATWVSASMLFGPCTAIALRLIKTFEPHTALIAMRAPHPFISRLIMSDSRHSASPIKQAGRQQKKRRKLSKAFSRTPTRHLQPSESYNTQ